MEEIDIKELFDYIKNKIFFVIGLVVILVAFVCVYDKTVKVPMYRTYTTLVLTQSENSGQGTTITQNDVLLNQKLVSTYSQIIKSKLILEQVIDEVKLDYNVGGLSKYVSVQAIADTEILKISVTNKDPKLATEIANSIANTFTKEITKIYKIDNVSIIDKAQVPETVCNNTFKRDIVLAIFAGIMISVLIIFMLFYFDDTIKYNEELEDKIGLPILSKVFKSDIKTTNNKNLDLVLNNFPKSLVSECVKTLRTNLQFSAVDEEIKTILVTSSIPGEGKSFISTNLAIAFAQTGKNVLLVDADLRKGRLHKIFRVSNTKGLSNLLLTKINKTEVDDYFIQTKISKLSIITRGNCPPNPSELLGSKKNKQLVNIFKDKFDIVIFDGTPCNGIADSLIMSSLMDKVIIVSSENITPKALLDNTKKSLEKIDASIAGVVINKISKKRSKYSRYYGYYGENE